MQKTELEKYELKKNVLHEQTLRENELKEILNMALAAGADFAEIFMEQKESTSISCEDGKIEKINTGIDLGMGIRVIAGEATSYVHSNDISLQSGLNMAKLAGQIGKSNQHKCVIKEFEMPVAANMMMNIEIRPETINFDEKIELLRVADAEARALDDAIRQVSLGYSDVVQHVTIANSLGVCVEDERVRLRFACNSIAQRDGQIQTGFASMGGTCGFELFREKSAAELGHESAQRAVTLLSAEPCPTGQMTVVMASEAGGTMVHEACGHGLEGDLVQKGLSAYAGKLGEVVASEKITVVDDATIAGKYGSYRYDDEGNPAQKTVLIENGVLKQYMNDYQTAKRTGASLTGNGRRESYKEKPITRMSNTYIAPGQDRVEDIIASTNYGLYVKRMGGGQVNTLNGDYVFDVAEGYLIENGRVTKAVRGATLAGNGPESLRNVEMVGDDFGYAIGTCGKNGQSAPVADAQPTLKIRGLTVGGTGAAK